MASLFHDNREEDDDKAVSSESGPSILKGVQWALQNCKTGREAGPDEVVVEMLIALQEEGVDVLWSLVKNIYETGQIPSETLKSVFISLPQKSNSLECENHRTISVMAHTLKLFLKIILQRIRRKLLPEIPTCQYGFMPDKDTRNAHFMLRRLCKRSMEHHQVVFCALLIIIRKHLIKCATSSYLILKRIGIDDKDCELYGIYIMSKKQPSNSRKVSLSGLTSNEV